MQTGLTTPHRVHLFNEDKTSSIVITTEEDQVAQESLLLLYADIDEDTHGIFITNAMVSPYGIRDWIYGYLYTQGIIRCKNDLLFTNPCLKPREDDAMLWRVILEEAVLQQLNTPPVFTKSSSASCGFCHNGRQTLLHQQIAPLDFQERIPVAELETLEAKIAPLQKGFRLTGGLHAAAIFDFDFSLCAFAEDIGRHNALDKVIGSLLRRNENDLKNKQHILWLSSRLSYELVEKAYIANISIVLCVGAPSLAALRLAQQCQITAVAFFRNQNLKVYTHPERIKSV